MSERSGTLLVTTPNPGEVVHPMTELVEITAQVINFLERLTVDQPVYHRELSGLKERITRLRFPD